MKKLAIGLLLCSLIGCKTTIVTLEAQTLPLTKVVAWDADPASEQVLNYTVKLDGVVVGSPTTTSQTVVFTTLGAHMLTVTATNTWGTSDPTTLNVNVVVPSAPKNPIVR